MRLLIISDVHLEFGPFVFPADLPEFDVAVFAGDVHQPVTAAVEWLAHERDVGALRGKPVVYVPGNHEFYHHEMKASLADGTLAAKEAGIHLLHRSAVVIDGVRFLGCILWTDYRLLGTPKPSMVHAGQELNDHTFIRYSEDSGHISRFMPWHAAAEHRLDRAFLRDELDKWHHGPTVVVTHHAPHPGSVQRRHQGSALSPAFASDLSELIIPYQPELWIHGHDHGCHDYHVGETRIFSNQAGYPRGGIREVSGFRPDCVIEVSDAKDQLALAPGLSRARENETPKADTAAHLDAIQQELLDKAGQRLTLSEAVEQLGISREALHEKIRTGAALGLMIGESFVFPAIQLVQTKDGTTVVANLDDVLPFFADTGVWSALQYLIEPDPALGGAVPLDRLKAGDVQSVIAAARAYLGLDDG